MPRRLLGLGAVLILASALVLPAGANPQPNTTFVFEGKSSAHGMGLAMDGVLGQARAGWDYSRILSGFYIGTTPGRAEGTIRVGLIDAAVHAFELPTGGVVSDTSGSDHGNGFPISVPAGGRVVVGYTDGRHTVRLEGVVSAAQTEVVPIPTEEPPPSPTPQPTDAPPEPEPDPAPAEPASGRSIWITPHGDPALVRSEATGRRYRGQMEARFATSTSSLWAINHVDMETYVQGIAEEKGQGWPVEALKVLAVAARSLGAATMQWYDRHHDKGFDICPTGMCQLYLGYDGEEPAMTQATRETAGEIRTFHGRPILAMYHGNGGGQTDSYSLMYTDGRSDPYPYLQSVRYAHANPSSWTKTLSGPQIRSLLAASGVAVPGPLERFEILARGESPRVRHVRLHGANGSVDVTGLRLRTALDLRSQWFDVRTGTGAESTEEIIEISEEEPVEAGLGLIPDGPIRASGPGPEPEPTGRSWALLALALVCAAGAVRVALPRPG